MPNIIGLGTNPLGGGQTIPDGYCLAKIYPEYAPEKYQYQFNNLVKVEQYASSDSVVDEWLVPLYQAVGSTTINQIVIKTQGYADYVTKMPTTVINASLVEGKPNSKSLVYKITDTKKPVEITGFVFACLIAGTLITLADGTKKPIEEITYDDNLLVWDFFNGCFASAKPSWIKIRQTAEVYNKLTFDNGTTLGLVGEGGTQGYHRIFNKQAGRFTHTGVPETPDGTITFADDVSEPVLLNQELIYDTVDYYNIITDKHFNLFANGILTSCKCSNLYHIENMNYVGERLISDEEVESYFKEHKNLQLTR